MSKLSSFGITSGLIALGCLFLGGCSKSADVGSGGPPPPAAVKVSKPHNQPVTDYAEFTGRTMAVESVKLRARVWGHLEKINFTEGADVKKNDVLFVIDQRSYKAALARTEAEVAQSMARYNRLSIQFKRAENLSKSNAISEEEFERITGDFSEAKAMVNSSKASRDVAKLNLGFTEIKAPITGQVGRALITVGNMVESGETGGTTLTTIMSTDMMYVYFDVDDQTGEKLRMLFLPSTQDAPSVQIGLPGEKGFPRIGKLDFVDNQVDPGTGTLRMRGLYTNKDRSLTPGLFVRVRLPLGRSHDALLIVDRAIDTDQGQKVLYIVNPQNVVEKRLVTLGALHDGFREIKSGIGAEDRVVIEGIQRVRAGVTVAPEAIEMSAK